MCCRLVLFGRDSLDERNEIRILAFQQPRQHGAEVRTPAPFPHVVIPGVPAPPLLLGHSLVVRQQVGAFKERDQHLEYDLAPLHLLIREIRGRSARAQLQIRIRHDELEKIGVRIREELIRLFVLVLALLTLLFRYASPSAGP